MTTTASDPRTPRTPPGRALPRARWLLLFVVCALGMAYMAARIDGSLYDDMVLCVNGGHLDAGERMGAGFYPFMWAVVEVAIALTILAAAVVGWMLTRIPTWLVVSLACVAAVASLGGMVTHHLATNVAQLHPGTVCAPTWPSWLPK